MYEILFSHFFEGLGVKTKIEKQIIVDLKLSPGAGRCLSRKTYLISNPKDFRTSWHGHAHACNPRAMGTETGESLSNSSFHERTCFKGIWQKAIGRSTRRLPLPCARALVSAHHVHTRKRATQVHTLTSK